MEAEKEAMTAAGQTVKAQGKLSSQRSKGTCTTSEKTLWVSCSPANNYEVIDMGVMVPCEKILERAKAEKSRHDRAQLA